MVASTNKVWLQTVFNMLTRLFDWVGLRKNVCKTVGTILQPCREVEVRADKAYKRQMIREGRSYQ